MVPSHLFTVFIGSTSLGTCNHKPSWVCFERERGKLEVKAHMAKGSVELKIQGFFFFFNILHGKQCWHHVYKSKLKEKAKKFVSKDKKAEHRNLSLFTYLTGSHREKIMTNLILQTNICLSRIVSR